MRCASIVIGAIAAIAQGYPLPLRTSTSRLRVIRTTSNASPQRSREPGRPSSHSEGDEGVAFPIDAQMLGNADMWTLRTPFGDLDVSYVPSGTQGYEDLRRDARTETIEGVEVAIASLVDIIRSKEAAGRVKDQAELPLSAEPSSWFANGNVSRSGRSPRPTSGRAVRPRRAHGAADRARSARRRGRRGAPP